MGQGDEPRGQRQLDAGKGGRRDDRAHQASRRMIDTKHAVGCRRRRDGRERLGCRVPGTGGERLGCRPRAGRDRGSFDQQMVSIRWLSLLLVLPWAVPSIPPILSIRFMLNPEWGLINSVIFRLTGADGPNWLNDPTLALGIAMLVHIWKSLPFWTLILIAGRLAIPAEHYEAASVDGASAWQKFKYVTWPSIRTLYLSSTILSMIWTLGDFNSVYLLTGGGPADLTHVLATLGIRYIRLDQVDLAMATIVCAMPLVLPLMWFMMKNLSRGDRQ